MKFSFFIFLQFLFFFEQKLKFVVEIFRHGARERLHDNKTINIGELTTVGERQHFLLGTQLRQEYIIKNNFLSRYFNQTEFNVITTNTNRTFQSALSQLYGFYPLGTGNDLNKDQLPFAIPRFNKINYDVKNLALNSLPLQYQPIPILQDADSFDPSKMDNFDKYIKEQRNTELYKQLLVAQNNTFETFKREAKQWNNTQDGLQNIYNVMDNIICDVYNGLPHPDYILNNQELSRNLTFLHDANFYLVMYQQIEYQAYFAQGFYKFLNQAYQKSQLFGKDLKWQMISAHDTTISLLQTSLNITSFQCLYDNYMNITQTQLNCKEPPHFTANLIFEYYDDEVKQKYVKVRYNGDYVNLCEKQQYDCNFEEFNTRINYFLSKAKKDDL